MRLAHYEVSYDEAFQVFEFVSTGPKGEVRKSVQFSRLAAGLYNLALGDVNTQTGEIDDLAVTDNGDSEKVLATVVEIVYKFCERFPSARVYATGSTAARTRLYRMGISKYYQLAIKDFYVLGQKPNDEWEQFCKGKDYNAFIVIRKEFRFGL